MYSGICTRERPPRTLHGPNANQHCRIRILGRSSRIMSLLLGFRDP